jgi:glutamate 5-kinase
MKKIVVKIGSSVIAPGGRLDSQLILNLTKDILSVEKNGYKVILVSSGAIACGLGALGQRRKPKDTHSLMAVSSLGQIILMDSFNNKFKKHKRMCAQILLTWDDFDNRSRFMNIRKTIDNLLKMNIIPIINENDVVSYEEIRFGDNDRLSSLVADLVAAEQLILLSDVEGLLEENKLVKEISKINSRILSLAKKEDKTHTSGGMFTKLEAAKIATSAGIKTIIASGRRNKVISEIIQGRKVGTLFLPCLKKDRARKRWIAFSKKAKGRIYIDNGAKEAFLNKGKSLLMVGITKVEGNFTRGDSVCVCDSRNVSLGCGIVNYDSRSLKEKKKFAKEVIHRDNFAKDL